MEKPPHLKEGQVREAHRMASLFNLFFCLIFFSFSEITMSHGKRSCSSSCGSLQNIKYPFHLRGDPTECGGSDFELNCEGNNTILEIHQSKYYVKDISYHDSTITLVDVNLAHGNCNLPNGSIYPDEYNETFWVDQVDFGLQGQATFINCLVKINNPNYEIVPCLSNNNSTIYVLFNAYDVGFVEVNCQFLFTVPMIQNTVPMIQNVDQLSMLDQLKQGFRLNWRPFINSMTDAIHICAKTAGHIDFIQRESTNVLNGEKVMSIYDVISPFQFEVDFLACLHEKQYHHSILTFYAASVIIIVLDITLLILVLLMIGRFLFSPLCVLSFLAYNLFKLIKPVDNIERFLQNQNALSPSRYSYNYIITITSNFKEKLGQGGFGSVYKGRLPGGYLVAVKMLRKSMGDGEDFINEVSTIGRIHHENRILNMDKLLEIALSVAKGLHYLHQGCNMGILHFDIKPHNILLDHKFTPKISDFGLAKLHPKDHSLVFMSAARGTIGYIAPELISRSFGTISHKSDVYSFGMLLMDMAGGRRHNDLNAENSSQVYYPSWIYDKLNEIEMSKNFGIFEIDDFERKLCKVGLSCIQTRPVDRPSMINVVEMLQADVDSLQLPPKPFFSSSDPVPSINISMDYSKSELSIILENM
ncbi:hypothetical protein KFK09_011667 [Dendrobium nobile]|uniref:Protein kinase domain-containing protein n=1 Tax=Dendrobium nobile TaxID=94219 RepID=A0A8T3BD79_DENNO|nr:hypothetical protein KFK09_011667 [Dendrobium nobile]